MKPWRRLRQAVEAVSQWILGSCGVKPCRWAFAEVLEPRQMLSFSATLSADASADEGSTYTLRLHLTGTETLSSWSAAWGDGSTTNAITGLTATHTYADGPHTYSPTATVTTSGNHTFTIGLGLDPSFGTGSTGIVTSDPNPNGNDWGYGMAVQGDGKILVAGLYNGQDFGLTRYNDDGTLDASFGGGTVHVDFFGGTDTGYALAIQGDGKIVVAGSAVVSGSLDFALARFDADGTLDTTFGAGGKVTTPFSATDTAYALAVQSDGKIVAAGYTSVSYSPFAVARYNSNGTLDTSFNGTGKKTVNFPSSQAACQAIVIQSDNKIVLGGYASESSTYYNFALARLNTDGSVDTSFGSGGLATTDFGASGCCGGGNLSESDYSLILQPDGKIVAAGYVGGPTGGNNFAIARYQGCGCLDNSFGSAGKLILDYNGGSDAAYAVALQGDGKLVVAGAAQSSSTGGTGADFAFARYNSNGTLDTTIGSAGKMTSDLASGSSAVNEIARAVKIQPDGKILLAGYAGGALALARYQPSNRVMIKNVAPTAALTGGAADEGSPAVVSFTGQSDCSEGDTAAGFHYAYDINNDGAWDLGDGTYNGSPSSGSATVPAAYLANGPGAYIVHAHIIDRDEGSSACTASIQVNNVAPTATGLSISGGPIYEGGSAAVSFVNPTDTSADDLSQGLRYSLALDETALAGTYSEASTEPSKVISFNNDGLYIVYGRIFDAKGGSSIYKATITVRNEPAEVTINGTASVHAGSPYTLLLSVNDPGASDIVERWDIDWGDGVVTSSGGDSSTASHIYRTAGTYTITASVLSRQSAIYEDSFYAVPVNVVVLDEVAAPSDLTAIRVSSTAVALTWRDNSSSSQPEPDGFDFQVERSANGGAWTQICQPPGPSFNDATVQPGTSYEYRVRACRDGTLYSSYSSACPVTTLLPPVTALQVTRSSPFTSAALSWQYNVTNVPEHAETGFAIEWVEDPIDFYDPGAITTISIGGQIRNHTVSDLDPTKDYYYRVKACKDSASSEYSEVALGSRTFASSDAPSNVRAIVSRSRVELSWTDNSSESWFQPKRSDDRGINWVDVGGGESANVTSCSDYTALPTGHFLYKVVALGSDGMGFAESIPVSVVIAPIAAPGDLTAEPISGTEIRLSWVDNSDDESSFKIYRMGSGSTWEHLKDSNVPSYIDKAASGPLLPGATYQYMVQAVDTSGRSSAFSNVATATIGLRAPAGVVATTHSATEIELTWEWESTTTKGFIVEQRADGEREFTEIGRLEGVGGVVSPYKVKDLVPATAYTFRVRAYSTQDTAMSAYSRSVRAVTLAEAPEGVRAKVMANGTVRVSWRRVAGAAGYTIQRALSGGTPTDVGDVDAGTTSWLDSSGLIGKTVYDYRVIARNSEGGLSPGSVVSVTTLNQPAVVQPPVANPQVVHGNETMLSVVATDEDAWALRYTWTTVSKPPGATEPTFSGNDSKDAMNISAGFSKAGIYALRVSVRDLDGAVESRDVTVTVMQFPSEIVLSPGSTTIRWSETRPVAALVRDQFGDVIAAPQLNWVLSGPGSLSAGPDIATRLYHAPGTSGSATVTATVGSESGNINLTIGDAPSVTSAATGSWSANAPTSASLNVGAAGAGVSYVWSAVSRPPGGVEPTFSQQGSSTTEALVHSAGVYLFEVEISCNGQSTVCPVRVTVQPVFTRVDISAGTAVSGSGVQRFSATAKDQFSNPLSEQPTFTWSIDPPDSGSITADGVFTPSATSPLPQGVFALASIGSSTVSSSGCSPSAATERYIPRPTGLRIVDPAAGAGAGQVKLQWDDHLPGRAAFKIYYSSDGTYFTEDGVVGPYTTAYTVTDLDPGETYYFRVTAYNQNGGQYVESDASNIISAQATPEKLTAPYVSYDISYDPKLIVDLRWSWYAGGSSSAPQFQVQRSGDELTGWQDVGFGAFSDSYSCSFSDDSALPGAVYYYRVRAVRGVEQGPYSRAIVVRIPLEVPLVSYEPEYDEGGQVVDVLVTWAPVANATGYQVEHYTGEGWDPVNDPSAGGDECSFSFSPNTHWVSDWIYRVRAYNALVVSAPGYVMYNGVDWNYWNQWSYSESWRTAIVSAGESASLTVWRAHPWDNSQPETITYSIASDSAVAGADYQSPGGEVVIPAGQPSAELTIQTLLNDQSTSVLFKTVDITWCESYFNDWWETEAHSIHYRLYIDEGRPDLRIGSDNCDGYWPTGGASVDSMAETSRGQVIIVNDKASDSDGEPEFADFYRAGADYYHSSYRELVPLVVNVPGGRGPNAQLIFEYDDSDPAADVPAATSNSNGGYVPGDGSLRIWGRWGEYLSSGERFDIDSDWWRDRYGLGAYDLDEYSILDPYGGYYGYYGYSTYYGCRDRVVVWVEAVRASQGPLTITVKWDPDGAGPTEPITTDSVTVTAVQAIQDHYGPQAVDPGGALAGLPGSDPAALGYSGAVRYVDGTVRLSATDIETSGFGITWGHTRTWTNQLPANLSCTNEAGEGLNGNNVVVSEWPQLIPAGDTMIAVVGGRVFYFDNPLGDGGLLVWYYGREESPDRFSSGMFLSYDEISNEFLLRDLKGNEYVFSGFAPEFGRDPNDNRSKRGTFKRYTNADGNGVWVRQYSSGGYIQQVFIGNPDGVNGQTMTYYYGAVAQSTRLTHVELAFGNKVVQRADYIYSGGNLQGVTLSRDTQSGLQQVEVDYYTYHSDSNALKYAFLGDNYQRYQAGVSAETCADYAFTYDGNGRVQTQRIRGAGGSSAETPNALGTFTYSYEDNPHGAGIGRGVWSHKTEERTPATSGSTNVVYTNHVGNVLLRKFSDAFDPNTSLRGKAWCTFYKYDEYGRIAVIAEPSAMQLPNEPDPALLPDESRPDLGYAGSSAGDGLLSRYSGVIYNIAYEWSYGTARPRMIGMQRGLLGTASTLQFIGYDRALEREREMWVVSSVTPYDRDATQYKYVFDGTHIASITTVLPCVGNDQNGPGFRYTVSEEFDEYGRLVRQTSAEGVRSDYEYDTTGALKKETVRDADGLGLQISSMQLDSQGRPLWVVDPMGTKTEFSYVDTVQMRRVKQQVVNWAGPGVAPPVQWTDEYPLTGKTWMYTSDVAGNVLSLTVNTTDMAGRIVCSDRYFDLSGIVINGNAGVEWNRDGSDPLNGNFYRTTYAYNFAGLYRVRDAVGTITSTVYDSLGRPWQTLVGHSDSAMVITSENEYDGNSVGDGNLTRTTAYTGVSGEDRVTRMWYDWQNRLVAVKEGVDSNGEDPAANRPLTLYTLDASGNRTVVDVFDGDNIPVDYDNSNGAWSAAAPLLARTEMKYDDLGRMCQSKQCGVNPDSHELTPGEALVSDFFYGGGSGVLASYAPGGLATKMRYDSAARPVHVFRSDGGGDRPSAGGAPNWLDAADVSGDIVIEQVDTEYDKNGNPIFLTTSQLNPNGNNYRVSHTTNWYDAAGRLIETVDWGTNAGAYSSAGGAAPPVQTDANGVRGWSAAPDGNDCYLITSYRYDAAGRVTWTTDPRGIRSRKIYDAAGRVITQIDGFVDGTPTLASGTEDDHTTWYRYDGVDHMLRSTVVVPNPSGAPGSRSTIYVYGATINSTADVINYDLLLRVMYPRDDAGHFGDLNPNGKGFEERYGYNALGEATSKIDRSFAYHEYQYDVMGRQIADRVTYQPGLPDSALMDGSVGVHRYSYDALGRLVMATSLGPTGSNPAIDAEVKNQVQRVYNGLGQLKTEYQEHNGPVISASASASAKVQYEYEMANGGSRLKAMTYPDGREITYEYGGVPDAAINRVTAISGGGAVMEQYAYLGLGTVVQRMRALADGKTLTLSYGSGMDGVSGGYLGLDSFGRVVEQKWVVSGAGGSATVEDLKYAYDADSNVLSREDLVSTWASEIYQADYQTAATAYDLLNRRQAFQRGTVGGRSGGRPTAIDTQGTSSQGWSLVAGGGFLNWQRSSSTPAVGYDGREVQQREVPQSSSSSTNEGTYDKAALFVRYDAWGQLAWYKNATKHVVTTTTTSQGGTSYSSTTSYLNVQVHSFAYDALGRRIKDDAGDVYFDAAGKIIEERAGGGAVASVQYVWSADGSGIVLRDRNVDNNPSTGYAGLPGGMDQRLYPLSDAQGSTTALLAVDGSCVERYQYTPDGERWVWGSEFVPSQNSPYRGVEGNFGWRPSYRGGWHDGNNLHFLNGREMDATGGTPLGEDPSAYWKARNEYDPRITLFGNEALGSAAADVGDLVHPALDVIGVVDPTGIADLINAALYGLSGDLKNMGVSLAGAALPFLGDLAKFSRFGKILGRAAEAVTSTGGVQRAMSCRIVSSAASGLVGAGLGAGSGFAYGFATGYIESGELSGAWDAGWSGAKFGAIQGGIGGAVRGFINPYVCFVAGTQVVVAVADGDGGHALTGDRSAEVHGDATAALAVSTRRRYITQAIEELVARGGGEGGDGAGQILVSRDQHDPEGRLVRRRITRTYLRMAYHLQVVTLYDGEGNQQTIRVTEEHPFYVTGRGWRKARELSAGERLLGAGGEASVVVGNLGEAHPEGVTVYNLEVEEAHTFFVRAEGSDAEPVWVHNAAYDTQGRAVVRLSREPGMSPRGAAQKAISLAELSKQGVLIKASEPVVRNRAVSAAFRQKTIDRIWAQYGARNPKFAEALIERVTTKMSPDHVWELQLGGPDIASNLRWLDRATNELFGQQIRSQLMGVPTGTRVHIRLDGF